MISLKSKLFYLAVLAVTAALFALLTISLAMAKHPEFFGA